MNLHVVPVETTVVEFHRVAEGLLREKREERVRDGCGGRWRRAVAAGGCGCALVVGMSR